MTLDEAIAHARTEYERLQWEGENKCASEHLQLCRWLKELKLLKSGDVTLLRIKETLDNADDDADIEDVLDDIRNIFDAAQEASDSERFLALIGRIVDIKPNENCLEGMRCPNCGWTQSFDVEASCAVTVKDDGTDDARDFEWDDNNWCVCCNCGFNSVVAGFKKDRYHRTVYQLEVLSRDRISDDMCLRDIIEEATTGGYSADFDVVSRDVVGREEMAELLIKQNSDPDFLLDLDEELEDTNE